MELLKQAINSMSQASVRMALTTWMAYASEHQKQQKRVRRGLAAIILREARAAYNTWSALASQHQVARSAMVALTRRSEVAMLRVWAEAAAARSEALAVLQSSLGAMRHRGLRAVFTTWSIYASDASDSKQNAMTAIRRRASILV